jgi:hypothetical protein
MTTDRVHKVLFDEKGEYHCEYGPAYNVGNYEIWYIHGEMHREDGPAFIDGDKKAWYINGKLHRKDGPAFINSQWKSWYINGERHREDGPAHISKNYKEWYINDIRKDKEWVKKYLKIKNMHMIAGVIVSNYWKIREIILRWRYNPNLKCVKNRLLKEFNSIKF